MKKFNLKPIAALALVTCTAVHAQQTASLAAGDQAPAKASHAVQIADEKSIELVMKALFDKPGAPLKVAPVSVEGAYAVAGWIQNDRGGRALLKKENGQWSIQVCGGDGLKQASTLTMTGMNQASASRLAQKVSSAEKLMPTEQVKKLALFEGVVKVDGGTHDPHKVNHGHATHSK